MNTTKIAINLTLAVVVGLGIWFALHNQSTPTKPNAPVSSVPGQLPHFVMQDTEGAVIDSKKWDGKVLIVNYWATWCPPCREEMPVLIEFQNQYAPQGVQVLGVAVDDLEQVKDFMDTHGINFPVVVGEDDAIELGKKMGNRIAALPYTAIFDRNGKTLYAQPGKVTEKSLEQAVTPSL